MTPRTIVPGDAGQALTYDAWARLVTSHLSSQGLDPRASSSRLRLYFDCGYTPSSAAYAERTLNQRHCAGEQVH